VELGIAPNALLETDPVIIAAMFEYLEERRREQKAAELGERLRQHL
jgi:hypothetical protein